MSEQARSAELDHILKTKRSSTAQQKYLTQAYGPKMELPKRLASKIPAMHPECKMSINLPAHAESHNIYKALYEYTVRQKNPDGSRLNPNYFEINILLNRPNSTTKFDKATREQIQKFQRDYPEYHVHLIEHTFNFTTSAGKDRPNILMGEIYKTAVDVSIYRNLQRANGINKERLILRSGGADAKEKSPLFIDSVLRNFSDPRVSIYKSESQLPQQFLDKCPLYDIAYRVQTGLNRLWTKASSNLGIGSYSAEIYSRVGGFQRKKSIAEDKELSTKMGNEVRRFSGLFDSRKELHVNALDDPRRGIFAMMQGIPLARAYDHFKDPVMTKQLRSTDWTKKITEGVLPTSMILNPKNLSRELTALYRQNLRDFMDRSQVMKDFKRQHPAATKNQIKQKAEEYSQEMLRKLFDSMGIPKDSYTFKSNPAEIEFRNISGITGTPMPSYQEFLIKLYAIIN